MNKSLFPILAVLMLSAPELPAQTNGSGELFPPPEEPSASADDSGYAVLARVDKLLQGNDPAGAETLASESLNRIENLRALFFSKYISALLAQDKAAGARDLFAQSAPNNPELARSALDLFHAYYMKKGDAEALIEWTKHASQLHLPGDLTGRVFAWQLQAACSGGVSARAGATIKEAAARCDPETCRAVFAPAIEDLIKGGKYEDASRLLQMIESACRGKAPPLSLACAARARVAVMEKRWDDAGNFIIKNAGTMSEGDLAEAISFCASSARDKNEIETVEKICSGVFEKQKDKPHARQEAAACSLRISATGRPGEIPAKLDRFLAGGMAPDALFALFNNYFYQVVLLNEGDHGRNMLAFGKKLYARLGSTESKKQAAVLLVDGCFIAGDYAGALETVEANKALWDADWSESAKIKIGAHLALQNNRYKEAVEGFRKYMDYLSKNNEVLRDPLSGQLYTSDMMLGFNAMRIGDILRDKLADREGARKAYDEAGRYLEKAAASAGPNSLEANYINEQMKALADRKK